MNLIDRYIEELEGNQKEWTAELVQVMRNDYPEINESFEFEMQPIPDRISIFLLRQKRTFFIFIRMIL